LEETDEIQAISPCTSFNEPINDWIPAVDRLDEVRAGPGRL